MAMGHLLFSMDVFSFHMLLDSVDSFLLHKKYTELAQAVALYSEMMHLLHRLYHSKDATENLMAMGLLDRLVYGSEPLDRIPKLLSKWTPGTTTREYLCGLVESVHMQLKLMEEVASSSQVQGASLEKLRVSAVGFDLTSYLVRKLVSNHTVFLYTHLLSQYSVNSPQVNHRVMTFLLRLSKVEIATNEDDDDAPRNPLTTKTVTLEPMLYNMQMMLVLNQILQDSLIRDKKEYSSLLQFAARLVRRFAELVHRNPFLYVECLFRHPAPQRFCDQVTNLYVNDELRMMAERELLLEEQQRFEDEDQTTIEEESAHAKPKHTMEETKTQGDSEESGEEIEFVFDDSREPTTARTLSVSEVSAEVGDEDRNS